MILQDHPINLFYLKIIVLILHQKPDLKLGELPEPKPNIIYASTGSKSNNSPNSSSGPIGGSGVLADVPLIQPNNPDNFSNIISTFNL